MSVNRRKAGGAEAESRVPEEGDVGWGMRGAAPVQAVEGGDTCAPSWWDREAIFKQVVLVAIFVALFLLTDGSSTASQKWEGAPTCYLPVGLSLALMLFGGKRYYPVVFVASVVATMVNYHRPFLSSCGLPGAVMLYVG